MHWFKWASFRGLYEESVFQSCIVVDLTYLCEWVTKEFIWEGGENACPCPSTPNALWSLHMIPNLPICIRRAQTRLCGWADWGIRHNTEVSHSLCTCSSSSCVIGMCIARISTWLDKLWALTVIFCQYTLLSRPLVPRYRRQRSTSAPSGPILANTTLTVIRFFGTRYLYKGNFHYQSISLWLDQHHPSSVPRFPLHGFHHHVERNLEVRLWLAAFPCHHPDSFSVH